MDEKRAQPTIVRLEGIRKGFKQPGGAVVDVLKGIDLSVRSGEITAIVGPSGSGKSTLLQIIGLMEKADSGTLELFGKIIDHTCESARDRLRRQSINFLFQFDSLLEELTVIENLRLALDIKSPGDGFASIHSLARRLGLEHKLKNYPKELSGGEKTRANIIRALLGRPRLLLADEPTGNLDPKNAKQVFEEFMALARESGAQRASAMGIILVTHNMEMARLTDTVYYLQDGKLVTQS